MSLNHVLFAIMALIWGATWIAIRAGIGEVPPVTFGAARYILVSAVLLLAVPGAWATLREPRFRSRVAATGLLVNALTYGLLFWGMQHVASGVAGLVNLSMIAVGLFGLAVLFGDERSTWRHAVALLLGVLGLVALFWGRLGVADSGAQFWGLAAIIAGTFAYCLGSVLSRPLLRAGLSPLQLSGAQAAVGAVGLGVAAALLEAPSPATLARLLAPGPLAGLLFLVVFGTFVAYTIYLRLVRDWGAPRAGLYAFVSPVVALGLGAVVFGEPLGVREAAGAGLMLAAAAAAVWRPQDPATSPDAVGREA